MRTGCLPAAASPLRSRSSPILFRPLVPTCIAGQKAQVGTGDGVKKSQEKILNKQAHERKGVLHCGGKAVGMGDGLQPGGQPTMDAMAYLVKARRPRFLSSFNIINQFIISMFHRSLKFSPLLLATCLLICSPLACR